MKLRTIGSAPKDGTRIVLFEANEGKVYNCFSGFWNRGEWSHDGAYELRFSHWCPLPTLEDDAELQAVKAERDSLRDLLQEIHLWHGPGREHYQFGHLMAQKVELAIAQGEGGAS